MYKQIVKLNMPKLTCMSIV